MDKKLEMAKRAMMPVWVQKTFNAMRVVDAAYAIGVGFLCWRWLAAGEHSTLWVVLWALSGSFSAICAYYGWSPKLAAMAWEATIKFERKLMLIMALRFNNV